VLEQNLYLFEYDDFTVYTKELITGIFERRTLQHPGFFWRFRGSAIEHGPFKTLWQTMEHVMLVKSPVKNVSETTVIPVNFVTKKRLTKGVLK
jgi:hypothetical protein